MKRITLAIPMIALLMLGAHAFRHGDYGLTTVFAGLVALMFTRHSWVRLAAICALFWGGYIWADATVQFISFRQTLDLPWRRLLSIMIGIMLLDVVGLCVLVSKVARDFYNNKRDEAVRRAAIVLLVTIGLAVARAKVSFPILLADRYFPGWGWVEIGMLAFYAQWIGSRMMPAKGHRVTRPLLWGFFSVVFFGQLILGMMGMERMLMTGTLHLPVPALIVGGPLFRGDGYFMIFLFAVTVLLVGPAWCSHLCYIGAWEDGLSRTGRRPAHNSTLGRLAIFGRLGSLVLIVGTALLMRVMGVSVFIAVVLAGVFGLIGIGIMVFVSRKNGMMVHCTTYCPIGLIANVAGRLSPWRMQVREDCNRCGVCYTRCRYNALDDHSLELGRPALSCTLCGDCVSGCANGHINYRLFGLNPDNSRSVFIVLVVSLHAIFLGVARI